ncbi:MAG: glycosyltransferase [Pseudonocardia sediminis]
MRVSVHPDGPAGHGVVRHADLVARLAAAHGVRRVPGTPDDPDVRHAHFSDSLHPGTAGDAAESFGAWAGTSPSPLVVTLHDVPGADPDPARDARRIEAYRAVTGHADAVVVAAEHEAAKVLDWSGRRAHVVELPLPELPLPDLPLPDLALSDLLEPDVVPDGGPPTLGVLGFVYPGKGHAEAVEAAGRRADPPRVLALGAVSPGHDGMWSSLVERARELGVDLAATGHLTDAGLAAAAAAVTVPLAPNSGVSASGSLLAWVACRRRPLAADGVYAREIDARHPGLLRLHAGDAELDAAITDALASPGTTRTGALPPWPDAGAAHARIYADVLECARC